MEEVLARAFIWKDVLSNVDSKYYVKINRIQESNVGALLWTTDVSHISTILHHLWHCHALWPDPQAESFNK